MDFIENYKNLFDLVADLPDEDPHSSYTSLMKPVELKETAEAKKLDNGSEDNPNSASYVETEEEHKFKEVKPEKDTVLTPKVSGAAEVIEKNSAVTDADMPESLKETVKDEIFKIRNGESDEKAWDSKSNQVKNMFNSNVNKMTKPKELPNIINAEAYNDYDEKFPKIKKAPEFLKVKDIQPVTKVKVDKIKAVKNNTVGYDDLKMPVNTKFICDDWDDNAKDAVKKFRETVDKMKGMSKYTDEYKNRCANLLYKYKDLPKKQFESLCDIMESVNR